MSMSSSVPAAVHSAFLPLNYREVAEAGMPESVKGLSGDGEERENVPTGVQLWEVEKLMEEARAGARNEAEQHLRTEYERKLAEQTEKIGKALTAFDVERSRYFAKAEGEVVQLALSIAAKVLHRESQVDPFLLRAMVKVSMEKLQSGSTAHLHVAPNDAATWREYVQGLTGFNEIGVVEDDQVTPGECVLRTEMGAMDFSIATQLKDIEKAFFDLLAQRPISE